MYYYVLFWLFDLKVIYKPVIDFESSEIQT